MRRPTPATLHRVLLVVLGLGGDLACGNDSVASERDASGTDLGKLDAGPADGGDDVNAHETKDAGLAPDVDPRVVAWAADWIAAYDRQIAATCACFVMPGAFASAEDCMAALGSGPTWLECSTRAVAEADAGGTLDEHGARCLIDSLNTRAACLEAAGCGNTAMTDCFATPDRPDDCAAPDSDLIVLLLERCPDLGLLSR